MAATSSAVRARRRAVARTRFWSRIALLAVVSAVAALAVGLVFAGSPSRLASGTRIAGIDVGGLTPAAAGRLLEGRARRLQGVPVTFRWRARSFRITPRELGVRVDWRAAVDAAAREGGGIGVFRGYRRLELQLFPNDVTPPIHAYNAAVSYELGLMAKAIDSPHRDARLVRRGLHVSIAGGSHGQLLDRVAARREIVRALAALTRAPAALPVRADRPRVSVAVLVPAQRAAAQVIAAPVRLLVGPTRLRLARWQLATMLDLPRDGTRPLRFGGRGADAQIARLQAIVDRSPRDAGWRISAGGGVSVVPAHAGRTLLVRPSVARILSAAERPHDRVARLVVAQQPPGRTTAAAAALHITGAVGSYTTLYGGEPNRIHNVQLVAHLIDGKLIAPGATFSFNGTTGERSAAKGFRVAPVIINGELQTGLGGGVCQVSTTVFNAAFEAGLPITARTNHALYISHYPLGRDATVDYPDIDLRFVNDTGHWLLLRTFVGTESLTVGLYGTPQHRRVEATTAPLTVVSPPPVQRTLDATLQPGEVVVDDFGAPAQTTSVERKVYSAAGRLLSDQRWSSSYVAEPKIVRVGPARPKPKPKPKPTPSTTTVTTTTTSTTPTTTSPSTTTPEPPH